MSKKRKVRVWRQDSAYVPPAERIEPGSKDSVRFLQTAAVTVREDSTFETLVATLGIKWISATRPSFGGNRDFRNEITLAWGRINHKLRYQARSAELERLTKPGRVAFACHLETGRILYAQRRRTLDFGKKRSTEPKKKRKAKVKTEIVFDLRTYTPKRQDVVTVNGTTRVTYSE